MPIRSEWKLAREGITGDTLGRFFYRTALNPLFTLPLFFLARNSAVGGAFSENYPRTITNLKKLLIWGIVARLSSYLDVAVTNNWTNDVYDWNKELVIVTGGSDGIGALMVKLLAEKGIKVAVVDIQDLTYPRPHSVTYFKCDITSQEAIAKTAEEIRSTLGNPTILINNAGIVRGRTVLETTAADLRLTFGVNTFSHYFMAQQFLPAMVAANHGMIVTVASSAGWVTAPRMVDYCASKAAAVSFHEGLQAELASTYNAPKVRTVVVCPGYIKTKLFEGFGGSKDRLDYPLEPETVAEAVVSAVLSGRSGQVTLPGSYGHLVAPIRGWPYWMQNGIRKQLNKLMTNYKGRQVAQPNEKASAEGKAL